MYTLFLLNILNNNDSYTFNILIKETLFVLGFISIKFYLYFSKRFMYQPLFYRRKIPTLNMHHILKTQLFIQPTKTL
ncbi:hypothetical protein BDF21DRAFT_422655, partial [Thamnidium elegans]